MNEVNINDLISQAEIMPYVKMSRSLLDKRLREKLEPVPNDMFKKKNLYRIEDVEKLFGIKIKRKEEHQEVEPEDDFEDIKEILNED